jgi:serine/threonine-protein kinase HipA
VNTDASKVEELNTFDVYFNDVFVGKLNIDKAMRMSFIYNDVYMEQKGPSISLTIPLSVKQHEDSAVFPFIENLLPEGEIRSLIQRQNKIEAGNFSRFIELLGGDVAGALSIQLEGNTPKFEDTIVDSELSYEGLSQLLLDIQDRPFNVSSQKGEVGNRLSLAGAQNKLPVIRKGGKTFETKDAPSTHIIKPARKDDRFKSLVYNEYICMKAAKLASINTAEVSLLEVNDASGNESDALLIERYDRVRTNQSNTTKEVTQRLQQEDLCQLCSIPSTMKYEVSGGPGFKELFSKINQFSLVPVKDDIEVFKRLIFSLVIGNYDAHAKNFSFLVSADGAISLSPAYDLVCTALYEDSDTTFAMLIGEAKDLESLNEGVFKQLFNIIQKKYSAINKQLIKYADSSLKAVSDVVTEFKEGDYYQVDIDSVQHILEIAKANHEIVLKALQSIRK